MTVHPARDMDRPTRIQTILVLTIMGVAALLFGADTRLQVELRILIAALVGALVVSAILRTTTGYQLDEGFLVVRRRAWRPVRFRITGAAEALDETAALGAIRYPGASMLFGLRGRFWSSRLGRFRAYLTDRQAAVRCQTEDGPVLVSPLDTRAFVRDYRTARRRQP